jgi:UDP-perosamine 4-acetyltransferase
MGRAESSKPKQHPVIILGAGGHAKVIIDLLRAGGCYTIAGLLDPDPSPRSVLGVPVIGSDSALAKIRQEGVVHAFIAVGENSLRSALAQDVIRGGFVLINAVSPNAVLAPSVRLGSGVAIMPGAVINADSVVSDLAIVNTAASIDHDGDIGYCSHIAPGCAIAGNVSVGRLAFLGVGVSVIPGVSIGERAIIGSGACVVRDIPPGARARGVPARVVEDGS